MFLRSLVLSVLLAVVSTNARAEGPATEEDVPPTAEIEKRIEVLWSGEEARTAAKALTQARKALSRAREMTAAGRPAAADRARQIAWAALLLSERQIAFHQERTSRDDAERRARSAETEAKLAREALESALARRANVDPPRADPDEERRP